MYKLNKNYFDVIDTPEKAYWLGFIWGDGSVIKRAREGKGIEYATKIDLNEKDKKHLERFNAALEFNRPLTNYTYKTSYAENTAVYRLLVSDKHLGQTLYEKYGITPGRIDVSKIKTNVPKDLYKYFFLGNFDADGSLTTYINTNRKTGAKSRKVAVNFSFGIGLIEMMQEYFLENGLILNKQIFRKRHKTTTVEVYEYKVSGRTQVKRIMTHFYDNNTNDFRMGRKYEKYLTL